MTRCSHLGRPPRDNTIDAPTGDRPLRPIGRQCLGSGMALDPEAHEVVNEHSVSGLTAVLERYGGKLASSASERLMGVFGVATLHEDDALRAIRASLEARSALTADTGILLRRHGASLVCRFGLATGEALVGGSGPFGFAGRCGNPGGDARGGGGARPDPHQPGDSAARCGGHRDGNGRTRSIPPAIRARWRASAGAPPRCSSGRPRRGDAPPRRRVRPGCP